MEHAMTFENSFDPRILLALQLLSSILKLILNLIDKSLLLLLLHHSHLTLKLGTPMIQILAHPRILSRSRWHNTLHLVRLLFLQMAEHLLYDDFLLYLLRRNAYRISSANIIFSRQPRALLLLLLVLHKLGVIDAQSHLLSVNELP